MSVGIFQASQYGCDIIHPYPVTVEKSSKNTRFCKCYRNGMIPSYEDSTRQRYASRELVYRPRILELSDSKIEDTSLVLRTEEISCQMIKSEAMVYLIRNSDSRREVDENMYTFHFDQRLFLKGGTVTDHIPGHSNILANLWSLLT